MYLIQGLVGLGTKILCLPIACSVHPAHSDPWTRKHTHTTPPAREKKRHVSGIGNYMIPMQTSLDVVLRKVALHHPGLPIHLSPLISIWRFPKVGVPLNHPFWLDFHYKPTILGVPLFIFMEHPIYSSLHWPHDHNITRNLVQQNHVQALSTSDI